VSDEIITQRVSAEGADMLTLAGVNDSNLVELARLCGVKVALRGDALSISGPAEMVERAMPVAVKMVETSRQQLPLTPDDVLRLTLDGPDSGNGNGGPPGERRSAAGFAPRWLYTQPFSSGCRRRCDHRWASSCSPRPPGRSPTAVPITTRRPPGCCGSSHSDRSYPRVTERVATLSVDSWSTPSSPPTW